MNAQSEDHSFVIFRISAAAAALILALGLCAPAQAGPSATPAKAEARLIDGGFQDGARYAGVQVRLFGDAMTYWRDAGDAGVPPTFDFAGSDNIAEVEVAYPQPERINEEGGQAFGYRREVLFPIRVAPEDSAKPINLALKLDYAACDKICLPIHAELNLTLPPQPKASESQLVDQALRLVPKVLQAEQAAQFAAAAPEPPAAGAPQWRVTINGGEARDLFVEPPAGFYFDVRPAPEKNVFLLTLAQHPAKRMRPEAPLRVTVTGAAPVEFDLALPPKN
jgi:DsbC/DsbD-like thiol-disulfide interchange protein